MADGGVEFQIKLINSVTGPARQVQRSLADVRKQAELTRKTIEAPAPRNRRGAVPGFDQRLSAARRSQAKDFAQSQIKAARETARLTKIKARESAKEQKRVADFHKGMAQQK